MREKPDMADGIALRYQNREVVFEKSTTLVAARARAGMADALHDAIDRIATAKGSAKCSTIGAFEVVELCPSTASLDQDLDWLRAQPSVAAASHVFMIRGEEGLMVPSGHVELQFDVSIAGHQQQAILTRYRLQAIEQRGQGSYLVSITSGSKNPIATAAALQSEPDITFAEPEFVDQA
jgi:hypothetical protein